MEMHAEQKMMFQQLSVTQNNSIAALKPAFAPNFSNSSMPLLDQ